jgi:hypothetical protein
LARRPAERRRGVELLGRRNKANRTLVEPVHRPREIEKPPADDDKRNLLYSQMAAAPEDRVRAGRAGGQWLNWVAGSAIGCLHNHLRANLW